MSNNVWEIKKHENLNYILPLHSELAVPDQSHRCLIVVHLYYKDTVERYLPYFNHLPDYIDLAIFTSEEDTEKILRESVIEKENVWIIRKNNRGRDISTLLVAARTRILESEYVCFVHDKKERNAETKHDNDRFLDCLWDNLLGSREYIDNIIATFEQNQRLGVLLPPESLSDNYIFPVQNTWYDNFDEMVKLKDRLDLNCDLDPDLKPLSLGTAFWARTSALHKLFAYPWTYEDFLPEPLPIDGTLSHAVERCFAYVAQDSGYQTGIVMNDEFAGRRMDEYQEYLYQSFQCLRDYADIANLNEINILNTITRDLRSMYSPQARFYIYGAGDWGEKIARLLRRDHYTILAFLVSEKGKENEKMGIPIRTIDEPLEEDAYVILAVSDRYKKEMIHNLDERNLFPGRRYEGARI